MLKVLFDDIFILLGQKMAGNIVLVQGKDSSHVTLM